MRCATGALDWLLISTAAIAQDHHLSDRGAVVMGFDQNKTVHHFFLFTDGGDRYSDVRAGGRVDITTSDPEALDAVHAFLRYQIEQHKTGDH